MRPAAPEYFPAGQFSQLAWPSCGSYCPAGHSSQSVAPEAAENLPASQRVQFFERKKKKRERVSTEATKKNPSD